MVLLKNLAFLGALLGGVSAVPTQNAHNLHERRDASPPSWVKVDRLNRRTVLPMRIAMVQSNLERGHEMLMEVSHHASKKYGQYYTAEEVTDMFAPAASSVDAVRSWLESAGIAAQKISQSANKQWMQFDIPVEQAEQLLKTEYHIYEHTDSGRTNVACDEYHVPADVQEHIDYITPGIKLSKTSGLPAPKAQFSRRGFGATKGLNGRPPILPMPKIPGVLRLANAAANFSACAAVITPECIQALYDIGPGDKNATGNELGIFEDLGDVYAQEDLDLFFATYAPYIPQGTHPVLDLIDGAVAPTTVANAGPESDLDFQISYPLIWPQNSVLYQTDDPVYEANYTFQGFLNNFFDAIDGSYCTYTAYNITGNSDGLDPPYPDPAPGGYKGQLQCGVYQPTNVISISYGGSEADLPINYQRRQCSEIMKLGMRGITVLSSSGDSGVAGFPGDPSPNGCLGEDATVFNPQFPTTCPYITSVGGTTLPPANSSAPGSDPAGQEIAVTRFPSGGGFSNIYNRDTEVSWQVGAVEAYFAQNLINYPYYESVADNTSFGANGGIYNRLGRGYPDVSAIGDRVAIFNAGKRVLIGGTSASSPAFASILTRINEERIAVGKSTIGFVNDVLYANPEAFHDVTQGTNQGCGTSGFRAATGWDPVTGLGTPIYPRLLAIFLALP